MKQSSSIWDSTVSDCIVIGFIVLSCRTREMPYFANTFVEAVDSFSRYRCELQKISSEESNGNLEIYVYMVS